MHEVCLAENPAIYQEIFGDCQFHNMQVRKLLAAAALVSVKDFFLEPEAQKDPSAKRRQARAKTEAERYIFENGYLPAGDPFSFDCVCKALGVDPDYARRGIRARTAAEVKSINRKMALDKLCSLADYDED